MTTSDNGYLKKRVLKLNVGFLLNDGTYLTHDSTMDFPKVRVDEDLVLKYLRGTIRLNRTEEGILVQANLETALDDECFRCLEPINHVINVEIEELFAVDSRNDDAEFYVDDDAAIDLAPVIRAETLIEQGYNKPCRLTADGTCQLCHKNFKDHKFDDGDDYIDPRLAVLKQLLDK